MFISMFIHPTNKLRSFTPGRCKYYQNTVNFVKFLVVQHKDEIKALYLRRMLARL